MATIVLPDRVAADLRAIRDLIASIVPGGRDPEPSYMSKQDALRGIDRLLGDRA